MPDDIEKLVKDKYGQVASSGLSSQQAGIRGVAEAFGYSGDELASIPAEANMGLSCGNPTAFAHLKPGEVVVDLGCGGGLDVFLAAQKVGPAGRAIGIDMTAEMIDLARRNAARGPNPPRNVEFHLASIERLPLADASVDCIVSNCVINLVPDKTAVFREIARVLKPGGRAAISDLALKKPLPPELAGDVYAYVGCVAGAIPIDEYRRGLETAGLTAQIIDSGADLNAYAQAGGSGCCSSTPAPAPAPTPSSCCSSAPAASYCSAPAPAPAPRLHEGMADLLSRYDINDYVASVKVYAIKPL